MTQDANTQNDEQLRERIRQAESALEAVQFENITLKTELGVYRRRLNEIDCRVEHGGTIGPKEWEFISGIQ